MGIISGIFGTFSKRELRRIQPICDQVLALEDRYKALDDAALRGMTDKLRDRLQCGETLDAILPDAFAVCREASARVLNMRHFPVQIIGGIVLHQGRISEMKTGEGKTLVATLPAYLNALTGKGVHIVTVNDYLARRDSEWMGKVYRFLGLTVGLIVHDMDNAARREAYAADITYGTNNEFGFDYLRDNMVIYKENLVQRGHHFAIVDEVDSILIDEARTPLIISGQGDRSTDLYQRADQFVRTLRVRKVRTTDDKTDTDELYDDADYIVDEKAKTATLTQAGTRKAEAYFHLENLADPDNMTIQHHINQAIRAHGIMHRDVDYVVKDGQVIIVDEFTGRLMFGRRFNEGLHQAIEAKEHVKVEHESKTLATITFQNYFRLYDKLAGMTGTAMTEEQEFREIYDLDVIEIPTNRPMVRVDNPDVVYTTEAGKFNAVIEQVLACHAKGQPVLVGTISIEKSEVLSGLLKRRGIPHEVLNAKYHEKEAEIVAQAGKKGAVTIATNMAGRGTDIILGGNAEFLAKAEMRRMQIPEELISEATGYSETDDADILSARATFRELNEKYRAQIAGEAEEVRAAGGLYIIGTERHESRRIDNQLRGRSGRQGDPGASKFFLCLQDDLLRIFGADRIEKFLKPLGGMDDTDVISSPWISRTLQKSQEKVEARNFDIRKNLLKYDNVMNDQRKVIYDQRKELMMADSITDTIKDMRDEIIAAMTETYTPEDAAADDWNIPALKEDVERLLGLTLPIDSWIGEGIGTQELTERLQQAADEKMAAKRRLFGDDLMNMIEKNITLQILDQVWKEHLQVLEYMRHTIVLRAYGQKDPLNEYKKEAFYLFSGMIGNMREQVTQFLTHVELAPETVEAIEENRRRQQEMTAHHDELETDAFGNPSASQREIDRELERSPFKYTQSDEIDPNDPSTWGKVSRNAPCPCGSGKKYKHCHGAIA